MRHLLCLLFLLAIFPARAWEAKPLHEVAIHPELTAQAQVVSLNESQLAAQIAARVEAIPVEPGQNIAQGAVVARLDCSEYKLAQERAQANLDAAEARDRLNQQQLRRARQLQEKGFISKEVVDSRQATADASRAEIAVARTTWKSAGNDVGRCIVRAPFPAVVLKRLANVGEIASPGSPIALLLDRSRLEVRAEVPQAAAPALVAVKEARFITLSGVYPLELVRISGAVDRSTRLTEARLRFAGKAAPAGTSGKLSWRAAAPYVPPKLVVRRGGQLGIFVARDGQPRFLPLEEAHEGSPAAVDLPPETPIVVQGQAGLPGS